MHEIVMSGPGKNALGMAMMDFLLDRLQRADGRPVLLTGAGDAFSAGLNLVELSQLAPSAMESFLGKLARMSAALYAYPGPTVACVNGHAIAGGCILALACDHRVGAANSKIKIGLNEVALGLRFPPSILAMVRGRVAPPHLETVLLGAGLFSPAEALRLGLLDEVVEDPASVARARLAALAAHPPAAYAATKSALRAPTIRIDKAAEEEFRKEGLSVWTSPELRQRIADALKK